MQSSHDVSITTRAFARLHAVDVTRGADEDRGEGLFLTVNTDPERPEPEHFIHGA